MALGLAAFGALTVGPGDHGLGDVWAVLASHLLGGESVHPADDAILWQLRTPRVVLALTVGAALGGAGALTQGMFRNPLAAPSVLGVPSGAAFGVVAGFALGLDGEARWVTPVLAFVGSVAVLLALFALTRDRRQVLTLLLGGIALGAVLSAGTSVMLSLRLDEFGFARKTMAWMLGSFDGRGWEYVAWGAPWMIAGLVASVALHRPLDALFLGEDTAATLGVDPARLRASAAAVVAVLVGAATAVVGTIAFVGLIVPHIARAYVGPRHARLLPASMLAGAAMLLLVDTVGRALAPMTVAPGAMTSLLGGGFFLWLLRQRGGSRA